MDDFIVIRTNTTQPKATRENPIEKLLKQHNSLSLRQMKQKTGLGKKSINYYIYNSNFIEDTTPYIHGSYKTKIRVFNYNVLENNYFKRKLKKKNVIEEQI